MYKPERIRQENGLGAVVETYLTIEEVAEYLKLAEQTVRRWVLNREIPFHKIHKVIRFRVSEIEKWIDGEKNEELGMRNEEYPESNEQLEMSNEQGVMSNEQGVMSNEQ